VELIWKWPKITSADFLENARLPLNDVKADGIMVENVGDSSRLEASPKARIYGASGLNVWNHLTIQALAHPAEAHPLARTIS